MKKIIIVLSLVIFFFTGCVVVNQIPRPGFRVGTVRRKGSFERVLPYSITKGENPIDDTYAEGNVRYFNRQASGSGSFDVNDGRAPAAWYITAVDGWDTCTGDQRYINLDKGTLNYIVCAELGIEFPFSPSVVYSNSSPSVELQATVNGVNTTYGMPVFHFEDYTGKLIAATPATWVNGIYIGVDSTCLIDKPVGRYTVKVYNAAGSNSLTSQAIGASSILVKEPEQPTCTYGYEADIQACQSWGWTWDYNACQCRVQ